MAEKIKSEIEEEEEEEEEEDSVANIRHPRFIYKVRSVQAPEHPTTSFHMITPNASSPSSSPSQVMKMDETSIQKPDSNEYFSDESSPFRNSDHLPSSVIINTQQNPVPTITVNEGQQIIMGLTQDGQVIIGGLTMPINKKMDNYDQENASSMFCTLKTYEETVSLPMYQIPENLNEQDLNVKHVTGNEVVTGLTARGEFIIANTIDNSLWESKHLVSVIMGLAASGQIICGGCTSDKITKCVFTTSEKTIEYNDHQAIVDIIANLTANNEKVVVGLTDSNFTNFNESLLRRDSF